jgi:hypothetical protein
MNRKSLIEDDFFLDEDTVQMLTEVLSVISGLSIGPKEYRTIRRYACKYETDILLKVIRSLPRLHQKFGLAVLKKRLLSEPTRQAAQEQLMKRMDDLLGRTLK